MICNILAYSLSEDYRFFLKKIKYKEEIVYTNWSVDDEDHIEIIDTTNTIVKEGEKKYIPKEGFTFLDALSWRDVISRNTEELEELTKDEEKFLELFSDFKLQELEEKTSLFDITTEYPDQYYEFYTRDISLYIFPSKNYKEVKSIFEVLAFELPYTVNEVNNFWEASFYINLDKSHDDGVVRIVLQSKKRVFWLKIKKDRYNSVKRILDQY